MANLRILCADEDAALAAALEAVLARAGHAVSRAPTHRRVEPTVALWTRRSRASVRMQQTYDGEHLVVALCDDAAPPGSAAAERCVDLRGWRGDPHDPRLAALLRQVARAVDAAEAEEATGSILFGGGPASPGPASLPARPEVVVSPMERPAAMGTPPRAGAGSGGSWRGWLQRLFGTVGDDAAPPAARPATAPVALAATAPRACRAGAPFVAALTAYVEGAREQALQHLAALGETGDRLVGDVPASAWLIGAPVCVRLAAAGATVQPAEHRGTWDGRELLAPFTVTVGAEAGAALVLEFAVFVADIPVATVPLRVAVDGSDAAPGVTAVRRAGSAFASYASKDADVVTQRLSTLARWAPGLDIFLDCLDLRPGEDFKPQLAAQIAGRDVFLLFWSRHAAASPWVRWEFETAVARKAPEAILPMPIEDPAVSPLPPELAERHLRDRYLLAGLALRQIRGASPPP